LARELEVDRRTLRRYVVMLEELGIPIVTTQGRYGGYQVGAGIQAPADDLLRPGSAWRWPWASWLARGLGLADSMPAVA
jgi:hypothetical protein